jgi:hypothetical protein
MKSVDLASSPLSLDQALSMAEGDNLVLRTPEGREFVVAEIDDFDRELELVRGNAALNELLGARQKEGAIDPRSGAAASWAPDVTRKASCQLATSCDKLGACRYSFTCVSRNRASRWKSLPGSI